MYAYNVYTCKFCVINKPHGSISLVFSRVHDYSNSYKKIERATTKKVMHICHI